MDNQKSYDKRLEELQRHDKIFRPFNYGKLLESLFDLKDVSLPIVHMVFDMETLLIQNITDNCKYIWGYTKEEMEWMNIKTLLHPEDKIESILLADQSILIEGMTIKSYKNRHYKKDGNIVYLKWTTTKTFNYQTLCFVERITKHQFEEKTPELLLVRGYLFSDLRQKITPD